MVHQITKRQQSTAFKEQKEYASNNGNCKVMHFDFSENYSCAYQEGAQSTYWCQNQVTLFTVAVYQQSKSTMFSIISDKNDHSKVSVTIFLDFLLKVDLNMLLSIL